MECILDLDPQILNIVDDSHGGTPLHAACATEYYSQDQDAYIIHLVQKYKGDLRLKDGEGKSGIDLLRQRRYPKSYTTEAILKACT